MGQKAAARPPLRHREEIPMTFKLPALPFAKDALEPHMSKETFDYHHGKHHASYVKKLNDAVDGTKMAEWELERIIHHAAKEGDQDLFNNAAQHWNHSFFWNCLAKDGGGKPEGALASQIDSDFGSFKAFREAFEEKAEGNFASGWTWLVLDAGKLAILNTDDADTAIVHGRLPILTLDVWEHAYYIDYRNERPKFIEAFLGHLVNWTFAAENFANQGEGNHAGARRYDEAQEAFARSGKVEEGAKEAKRALDAGELDGAREAARRKAS